MGGNREVQACGWRAFWLAEASLLRIWEREAEDGGCVPSVMMGLTERRGSSSSKERTSQSDMRMSVAGT